MSSHDQDLRNLEQRRCEAITNGDRKALTTILSPDYVHVHATGKIDDREGFISGVEQRPRRSERGAITIRSFGDVAVLVGEQINHMGGEVVAAATTQVAARTDQGWRFVSMQVTRVA